MSPRSTHPSLQFLGATQTVTGSRFLVDTPHRRILVDCGLFQGRKEHRELNWAPFPIPPESIDTVVLTHAHIDHSGYLPALVRDGFAGPIVTSTDTAGLCEILLRDAAYLQEEEARYANSAGYSRHEPALPLYTRADAEAVFHLLDPRPFDVPVDVGGGVVAELQWAGHILGAASATIDLLAVDGTDRRVFFSGDVGRPSHPVLAPPAPPPDADALVIESTYGNRVHPDAESELNRLAAAINGAADRGGMVVVPAFAVDRTEVVLHALHTLEAAGRIPRLPIHVDSPMALDVLELYRRAINEDGWGIRPDMLGSSPFDTSRIAECRTTEESMRLAELTFPSIIISASGMATGGRVLHHLARLLPDPRNAVILTGFQADGTRGQRLADGERTLKIFGRYIPVRAHVEVIESFSVHADADELVEWLARTPREPTTCFLVHGSESSSNALGDRIATELGWCVAVPRPLERVLVD